ncbi:hypothetical protein V501_01012 [Pseudogymnoascus sp. VKM F-4519 (FW-2642)]|nr:hypothetical protein V501_01012 [Pseudogymnoascus sp. VKM F-4519 (FW-2642)]
MPEPSYLCTRTPFACILHPAFTRLISERASTRQPHTTRQHQRFQGRRILLAHNFDLPKASAYRHHDDFFLVDIEDFAPSLLYSFNYTAAIISTSHVLPLPKAVLALKIVQLVVAVVVLGLAAYGVTFFAFDGDCLMLFILISFAPLAWEVAVFRWGVYGYGYSGGSSCYDYLGYSYYAKKRDVSSVIGKRASTDLYTYRNALAAAASLRGLEFILFIVTLVITSIYLHRHRKAGVHCMPGALDTAPVTQEQKGVELQGQQPQQYYPATPQHDQQVASA